MRTIMIVVLLLTIQAWQSSSADSKWTEGVHLLPQFCKDKAAAKTNPEMLEKLSQTYGRVSIHIHHHCSGMLAEIKAKSTYGDEKALWLNKTVQQMEYMSRVCNTECLFYPDIHSRLGWALNKQGKTAQAIKQYQLVYQAKPNYLSAYTRLSRLYLKNNQPDEARKTLELGLKANPNSRALKKRLKKIESSR